MHKSKFISLSAFYLSFILQFLLFVYGSQAQPPTHGGFVVAGTRPPDIPVIEGKPLETREAINPNQKPAFTGQTRAPARISKTLITEKIIADHLFHPWSLAFMPDGRMLVTEKKGTLLMITRSGLVSDTIKGMPEVVFGGDGGLMDLIIDPDFVQNRKIYFTYVEPRSIGNGVSVASAQLSPDGSDLRNLKVIFRTLPSQMGNAHFGARLLFDKKGALFLCTGERFSDDVRIQAQWLSSDLGKILRINKDGGPASGNPSFPDSVKALPEIWAYGLRDPQGMTFNPVTGDLWEIEHGPQGGDEINIIQPGKNYGWPIIAYGTEYDGRLINHGKSAQQGMEQPIYFWDPAIAPSGATFYTGNLIPEWKNNLFVAALAGQHLSRLIISNNRVVGEERLLLDQHQRIRDVVQGPDEDLWVITDDEDGRLIRVSPK